MSALKSILSLGSDMEVKFTRIELRGNLVQLISTSTLSQFAWARGSVNCGINMTFYKNK